MRKSTKVVGALALFGAIAAGGSAFTASNTFSNTTNVAGYGEMTASGATVTAISYTPLTTDASKLASVTFTTSTDITGLTATMTLKNAGVVVGSPYSCTLGTYTSGTMSVTCATADNPGIATFDTTGLTVTQ